jgi:hypothetical protein
MARQTGVKGAGFFGMKSALLMGWIRNMELLIDMASFFADFIPLGSYINTRSYYLLMVSYSPHVSLDQLDISHFESTA